MNWLTDFIEDVKNMDVQKRAKRIKNRMPDVPEIHLRRDTFAVKDFLLGLAIGSTLGYLVALVFAPQSGEETRAYLSEKGRAVGNKAKDTLETTMDKTGQLAAEGRERVESALYGTRKAIDVTKEQGRDYSYEARERLSDTLDRAADEVDPNPRI